MIEFGRNLGFTIILGFLFVAALSCEKDSYTIKPIETPAGKNAMQPYLFANDGKLFMSWTEKLNDSVFSLCMAFYENDSWSDKIELDRGGDWFVNWADFSAISNSGKSVISHYLKKSDTATFSYDIKYVHSTNSGRSWATPQKLHSDSTKTEHGFVSFSPTDEDSFQVAWLDGRNTSVSDQTDGGHSSHTGTGAMQLRSGMLNSEGEILNEQLVDDRTCDCCQTSMVTTGAGSLIAYRDRSFNEIRDIYVSLLKDGEWSEPRPVFNDHWKINGCPVNGPKLAAFENQVCVAWFSAASEKPEVKLAFSEDGGLNFELPIRVDEGRPIGRIDLAFINEDQVAVSWMETIESDAELRWAIIDRDAGKLTSFKISELSGARATGFPQLEIMNKQLYFAWNVNTDQAQKINLVKVELDGFHLK